MFVPFHLLGGVMKRRRLNTTTTTLYPGQPHALPSRRHAELESDVAVPILQALAIGLASALALAIAIILLGRPVAGLEGEEIWSWAGRLAGTVGGLAWAGCTVAFVLQHRRALQQAQPAPRPVAESQESEESEPELTRIEYVDQDGQRSQYIDLPVGKDKLHRLARACLYHGRSFSRRDLSHVLSQGEYAKLAKVMIARGLARELPSGRELTPAGRAILRKFQ